MRAKHCLISRFDRIKFAAGWAEPQRGYKPNHRHRVSHVQSLHRTRPMLCHNQDSKHIQSVSSAFVHYRDRSCDVVTQSVDSSVIVNIAPPLLRFPLSQSFFTGLQRTVVHSKKRCACRIPLIVSNILAEFNSNNLCMSYHPLPKSKKLPVKMQWK